MNTNIVPFSFNDHQVRVVSIDGIEVAEAVAR